MEWESNIWGMKAAIKHISFYGVTQSLLMSSYNTSSAFQWQAISPPLQSAWVTYFTENMQKQTKHQNLQFIYVLSCSSSSVRFPF